MVKKKEVEPEKIFLDLGDAKVPLKEEPQIEKINQYSIANRNLPIKSTGEEVYMQIDSTKIPLSGKPKITQLKEYKMK